MSLDEIIDNIFVKNGLLGSKNDANQFLRPNDFETFLKICQRKDNVLGFGGHKTLDYLNLSFNLQVNYHQLNLYSTKYSKALHDFLSL